MKMPLRRHEDWTLEAKCQGKQDELFPDGADQKRVRSMCSGCRVRKECLAEALDNRIEWGVWGGMTERERRALLRRRSEVTSWRRLLEVARDEHTRIGPVDIPFVPMQQTVSRHVTT